MLNIANYYSNFKYYTMRNRVNFIRSCMQFKRITYTQFEGNQQLCFLWLFVYENAGAKRRARKIYFPNPTILTAPPQTRAFGKFLRRCCTKVERRRRPRSLKSSRCATSMRWQQQQQQQQLNTNIFLAAESMECVPAMRYVRRSDAMRYVCGCLFCASR